MRVASFEPSGFFLIRTPLLPLETLAQMSGETIRAVARTAEFREALFVASPGFASRFESAGNEEIAPALVRYVERAAGRPTPFGLFAGHTLGRFAEETKLDLPARAAYQRRSRLDMRVLFAVTDALVGAPDVRAKLRFVPNGSLHRAGASLRYVERGDRVVSVAPTEYLEATLAKARAGARLEELAAHLAGDESEVSLEEAFGYVGELVDTRLLVAEIEPVITTSDPAGRLALALRGVDDGGVGALLEHATKALAALDGGGVGASPERYRALASELEGLGVAVDATAFVQVNLWKPSDAVTMGPALAKKLTAAAALVARVGTTRPWGALAQFAGAFTARYEAREVPLLEALDEDAGVGFDAGDAGDAGEEEAWTARDAYVLRRVQETLAASRADGASATEWKLDARDLDALTVDPPNELPVAFSLTASLARVGDASDGDAGLRVHAAGISGQSGVGVMARLCVFDEALRARVAEHLREEAAREPNAIVAEVVHAPSAEIANGVLRPSMRAYEISCLSRSGAASDAVIPLSDLRVSVSGGRVVLRSERLGRVVLPRSTTAHNAKRAASSAYRFLSALARQGEAHGIEWRWGPLANAPRLPRVVAGDVVLAPAQWRIFGDELRAVRAHETADARFAAMRALRARRELPRHVTFARGDQALRVDLESALSVEAFLDDVKDAPWADVTEADGDARSSPVQSAEGAFAHEIVVPFLRRSAEPRVEAPGPKRAASAPIARTFIAGSEWLSTKIHVAAAGIDELLGGLVAPLLASVRETGAIDRWFFVPFNTRPERQLRLRFHGEPAALHAHVLPAIEAALAPWLEDGRVKRFEIGTYEREVERYGGAKGILLAEGFFTADSEAALALVVATPDGDPDARRRLVMLGHDALAEDLGLDLAGKLALVRDVRDGYVREQRPTAEQLRALGQRFREERASLEAMLDRSDADYAEAYAVFAARSAALARWERDLRDAEARGALDVPITTLARSYLHVSAGRLLRESLREQELGIADALARIYESRVKARR